jgi:hypothetical protein
MNTFFKYSWDGSDTKDKFETRVVEGDQPYVVIVNIGGLFSQRDKKAKEIKDWCDKQFGASTKTWRNPRWSFYVNQYHFKYEKDMALFLLRWSA